MSAINSKNLTTTLLLLATSYILIRNVSANQDRSSTKPAATTALIVPKPTSLALASDKSQSIVESSNLRNSQLSRERLDTAASIVAPKVSMAGDLSVAEGKKKYMIVKKKPKPKKIKMEVYKPKMKYKKIKMKVPVKVMKKKKVKGYMVKKHHDYHMRR